MEAIRMKWYDNLERLLECPVCLDRMEGHIYACQSGHNICRNCFSQCKDCGICRKPYTEARNFIAESLSSMIDGIKMSLIQLNFSKKLMGTQTDFDPFLSDEQSLTQSLQELPNEVPWGEYPCLLEPKCSEKNTFMETILHFVTKHKLHFEEHIGKKIPFTSFWNFSYDLQKRFDRAFYIPKVGLFTLHIGIENTGQMRGFVAMYDGGRIARQFSYQLEIECGEETFIFMGTVDCVRLAKSTLEGQGLFLDKDQTILAQLVSKKIFKCSVGIHRRIGVTPAQIRNEISKSSEARSLLRNQPPRRNNHGQQNRRGQQPRNVNSGEEARYQDTSESEPPACSSSAVVHPRRQNPRGSDGKQSRPNSNDQRNRRRPRKQEQKPETPAVNNDLFATLMKLDPNVLKEIRLGLTKIESDRSGQN